MISILHPSRQRPDKSFVTCKRWFDRAGTSVGIQLVISTDCDDTNREQYRDNLMELSAIYNVDGCYHSNVIGVQSSKNRSAVDAINKAAKMATGDIFIVVSDDTDCPENWAVDLLKAIEGKTDFVAKCPDGIQNWIITMPIMDRAYYNRFGYVYHPDYLHMFCDTELTCVADLIGRRIEIPIIFKHLHPGHGHGTPDALNARADATWQQGEDLFLSRLAKNFDLAESQIVGKITDESYRTWIAKKLKK